MMAAAFSDNIERIGALCVLIAVSGLISASETALFALTRQQLHRFRQSKTIATAIIIRLRENPGDLLSTVLLANIAVNILLYSMLGITVNRMAGDSGLRVAILGVVGFVIVLFGAEIIPKLIAYALSDRLAPLAALPLRALELITLPVRRFLGVLIVEPLTRVFSATSQSPALSADDLQELVNISQKEGLIDHRENVLLHQLMDLSDLRVSALMVPRVDVVAHDLADPPEELVRLIKTSRLLRIPVYEGSIDSIQGIVSAKDYLLNPKTPISQLVRPVHYIPEQARVEALLAHFRQSRSQFAVVVDEYGGLAGVIALEDIVEAIVGELRAPEEETAGPRSRLRYRAQGRRPRADHRDLRGADPLQAGRVELLAQPARRGPYPLRDHPPPVRPARAGGRLAGHRAELAPGQGPDPGPRLLRLRHDRPGDLEPQAQGGRGRPAHPTPVRAHRDLERSRLPRPCPGGGAPR